MSNNMDKFDIKTSLGSFPTNGYQPNTLISSAVMNKVLVELSNVMNGWINFLSSITNSTSNYYSTDTIDELTTKMKADMNQFYKNCQNELLNDYLIINKSSAKISNFTYEKPAPTDSIFYTDSDFQDFTTIYTALGTLYNTRYISFANKGAYRYMCIGGDIYVQGKYKVINENELCTINGQKLNTGSNIVLKLASTTKSEVIDGGIWFE